MGIVLSIGLMIVGFVVLLGTFSVIGRFGAASKVRVSIVMLALTLASGAIGPLYDLVLWTVIQSLVTIIWFLFYPTNAFESQGFLGPLVLLVGVTVSAITLVTGPAAYLSFLVLTQGPSLGLPGALSNLIAVVIGLGSGVLTYLGCRRRVDQRFAQGVNALRTLEARARRPPPVS